jgi:hypothetical protein
MRSPCSDGHGALATHRASSEVPARRRDSHSQEVLAVLDKLTAETFRPHVGKIFRVIVDEQWEMQARLTAVDTWDEPSAQGWPRAPFRLLFHAPGDASIPQRMYRLEADGLDPLHLFLVPLGPDADGMRYEAVFT